MANGPDTGEFIALTVTDENTQVAARQLAKRVAALSKALKASSKVAHQLHIERGQARPDTDHANCPMMSCRKAHRALSGMFND